MSTATAAPADRAVRIMEGPQTEFVSSLARHPAMFAGRRAGKTVAGITKVFKYCLEYPGARGVMTAPTIGQAKRDLVPVMKDLFGHTLGRVWTYVGGDQPEVRFSDGSLVYIRPSLEPDGLRGLTLAFFYMDEISVDYQHEAFLVLKPALTQEGFPHQGWVTCTPDWRKPWIRKLWVEHRHPQTDSPMNPTEYAEFHASSEDNFHLPKEWLGEQLALYGDTRKAEQEIRGAFIIVEGAGFPMFKESTHVTYPPENIKWRRKVAGLDFGGTSPTALIEVGMDENRRLWALSEFYQANAREADWVAWVGEKGIKKVICDPAGGEKKAKDLRAIYNISISLAPSNSFELRKQLVGSALSGQGGIPGLYISPSCPNLIGEIQNLALHKPRGHEMPIEAWQPGSSDHAYDALAYALMVLKKNFGPPPRMTVTYSGWDN